MEEGEKIGKNQKKKKKKTSRKRTGWGEELSEGGKWKDTLLILAFG